MQLVKMIRDDGHKVDVHPEMVSDYRKGGYQVIEAEKPKRKAKDAE